MIIPCYTYLDEIYKNIDGESEFIVYIDGIKKTTKEILPFLDDIFNSFRHPNHQYNKLKKSGAVKRVNIGINFTNHKKQTIKVDLFLQNNLFQSIRENETINELLDYLKKYILDFLGLVNFPFDDFIQYFFSQIIVPVQLKKMTFGISHEHHIILTDYCIKYAEHCFDNVIPKQFQKNIINKSDLNTIRKSLIENESQFKANLVTSSNIDLLLLRIFVFDHITVDEVNNYYKNYTPTNNFKKSFKSFKNHLNDKNELSKLLNQLYAEDLESILTFYDNKPIVSAYKLGRRV